MKPKSCTATTTGSAFDACRSRPCIASCRPVLALRLLQAVGVALLVAELQRIDRDLRQRRRRTRCRRRRSNFSRCLGADPHVVARAGDDELVRLEVLVEDHLPGIRALDPQIVRRLALAGACVIFGRTTLVSQFIDRSVAPSSCGRRRWRHGLMPGMRRARYAALADEPRERRLPAPAPARPPLRPVSPVARLSASSAVLRAHRPAPSRPRRRRRAAAIARGLLGGLDAEADARPAGRCGA